MKKILALVLSLLLVVSLVACGQSAPAPEAPAPEAPAPEAPAPEAPAADDTITLGLCNINEKGVFGKLVKYGFEQATAARGWKLVYADNNADGQTAVTNAELMVMQDVDFVVDMNVDASVGQTIMDIFNAAEIPVLAIDIMLPGAPFFGIDSPELGYFNGETAGKYIQENYDGEVEYVVLVTQRAAGEVGYTRVRTAIDALDDMGIKYGEVVEIEGENDTSIAQQRFTDFLTAHPDAKSIIVFTTNEITGQGVHAAACTAGREWDIRLFSANCGSTFIDPLYATEGNTSWVSTISNFTELYGEQACQLVEQYFAEGSIPDTIGCKLEAINWENVTEYYPKDNLPWNNFT